MKILSRYVFREILSSSFLATGLATFIIFLQTALPKVLQLLVRSAGITTVFELFGLLVPPLLMLSIPFGVLVGILVGLGRLSSDNEIVALRSAGVSSRIVAPPVLVFAFLAMLLSGACALWLNPLAIRAEYKILNAVAAAQLTANVEPRVFEDQFTNDTTVLYVDDVKTESGPVSEWSGVFIADLTPPSDRKTGLKETSSGPKVTVAREALVVPDTAHDRLQMVLKDMGTHEAPYHSTAPNGVFVLDAQPQQAQKAKPYKEMFTRELLAFIRANPRNTQDGIEARIELQRRLALPVACLMLAMVGIPLGTSVKKGGRSAGYVWAIVLAFFCYYLAYITLTSLARSRAMPVEVASWLPNVVFGVAGLIAIARMEMPGDRDLLGAIWDRMKAFAKSTTGHIDKVVSKTLVRQSRRDSGGMRLFAFQILDSYVLSTFLFYFVVWLVGWVLMVQVFTFFDLLGDVVKNNVPAMPT